MPPRTAGSPWIGTRERWSWLRVNLKRENDVDADGAIESETVPQAALTADAELALAIFPIAMAAALLTFVLIRVQ